MKRLSRRILGGKSSLFNYDEEEQPVNQQFQELERDRLDLSFNRQTERLQQNVKQLKEVTVEIGDIIQKDNIIIDEMENSIGGTKEKLRRTQVGLNDLTKRKSIRYMCILILFVVVVFFVLYFLIRRFWF